MRQLNFYTGKLTNQIKSFGWKILGLSFLLISLSPCGLTQEILWERNYGGAEDDEPRDILEAKDGSFVLTGTSESDDGDISQSEPGNNIWTFKIDNEGMFKWDTLFDETDPASNRESDVAKALTKTADNSYLVIGSSDYFSSEEYYKALLYKIDQNGNLEWKHKKQDGGTYTGTNYFGSDAVSLKSGYYYFLGEEFIQKLDSSGSLIWDKELDFRSHNLIKLKAGKFAITGYQRSSSWTYKFKLAKFDSSGNKLWEKDYGGSGDQRLRKGIHTSDGGFMLIGSSDSANNKGDVSEHYGKEDFWLVKLDANGEIEWEKSYGGAGDDVAIDIVESNDGNYFIGGYTDSANNDVSTHYEKYDVWLIKISSSGKILWEGNFGGSKNDLLKAIHKTSDGNLIVASSSNSNDIDVSKNHGQSDFWVFKLNKGNLTSSISNRQGTNKISCFPNPTQNQLRLQTPIQAHFYTLHTLTGQKAQSGKLSGKGTHMLDVSNLSSGVYLLEVQGEDAVRTKKVVVE